MTTLRIKIISRHGVIRVLFAFPYVLMNYDVKVFDALITDLFF